MFYKAIFNLWHCGGCLTIRAARLRLAVQAPAITTTEQGGTQSARKRAVAAEPLGDPPLFSVRHNFSFNAICMSSVYVQRYVLIFIVKNKKT